MLSVDYYQYCNLRPLTATIAHFLENTCLRTMDCLLCGLKAFSDCAYIYA